MATTGDTSAQFALHAKTKLIGYSPVIHALLMSWSLLAFSVSSQRNYTLTKTHPAFAHRRAGAEGPCHWIAMARCQNPGKHLIYTGRCNKCWQCVIGDLNSYFTYSNSLAWAGLLELTCLRSWCEPERRLTIRVGIVMMFRPAVLNLDKFVLRQLFMPSTHMRNVLSCQRCPSPVHVQFFQRL